MAAVWTQALLEPTVLADAASLSIPALSERLAGAGRANPAGEGTVPQVLFVVYGQLADTQVGARTRPALPFDLRFLKRLVAYGRQHLLTHFGDPGGPNQSRRPGNRRVSWPRLSRHTELCHRRGPRRVLPHEHPGHYQLGSRFSHPLS